VTDSIKDTGSDLIVNTIEMFLDLVRVVTMRGAAPPTNELLLFRGQCEDWPLVPRIGRPSVVKLSAGEGLPSVERKMMAAFKRQSQPFLRSAPATEWDWLALAQHHGLATRLLDWSQNPLVGLWFAVRNCNSMNNPVVWIFGPEAADFANDEKADPFQTERTKVFQPFHVSDRIRAQGAFFTIHKFTIEEARFVPFEKIKHYSEKGQLGKIQIARASATDIRRRLDLYGINEAVLFPGLDGLCHHIEWLRSNASAGSK
jgi:hypothetical protein